MRFITMHDLDQFIASLGHLREKLDEIKKLSVGANALMLATAAAGHTETALANGLSAVSALQNAHEAMYADFEQHAEKCLGERRKTGEQGNKFVDRLGKLSDRQLMAIMQRNRIMLVA